MVSKGVETGLLKLFKTTRKRLECERNKLLEPRLGWQKLNYPLG
jgi:hypothetical protein